MTSVSGKKLSEAMERAIVRIRRAGESIRATAAAVGVSTTTVQRVLKRFGVS